MPLLVGPRLEESTLDRYVDHIEHIAGLIGIDRGRNWLGISFEFIYRQWPGASRRELARTARLISIPICATARTRPILTRKINRARLFPITISRRSLFRNWMGIFEELLLGGSRSPSAVAYTVPQAGISGPARPGLAPSAIDPKSFP